MAKIAVAVPVFKVREEYLRECVESIRKQTFSDIEILLVDDGSPDESGAVLEEYARLDQRVRAIRQENRGVSAARNRGLREASADYIMFVDADDWIAPETCEAAYKRAVGDGLDVLLWGSYKCFPDRTEDYIPYHADIPLFSERRKKELMLKTMVGSLPVYREPSDVSAAGATCSKLYRRTLLTENGLFYDERLKRAEDVNFNIRVYDAAGRIGYLNKKFYYYRQLSDSAVYRYQENGLSAFTAALLCLREFLIEKKKDGQFWQVYYMRCVFFLLESTDIDYFHRENKKPLGLRMREMRAAMDSQPYREALLKLRPKEMGSFFRRIPVYLMRGRSALLVCVFFRMYNRLKEWKKH